MPCSGRKHTPIVSARQRHLFGLWASNPDKRPASITKAEVSAHLSESKGKNLPARSGMALREARHRRMARKR